MQKYVLPLTVELSSFIFYILLTHTESGIAGKIKITLFIDSMV